MRGIMQAKASPTNDFEVGKISLLHLVWADGLGVELVGRLDHDVGRAGNQVIGLQQAINRCFRYEVAPLVGEPHGQFPGGTVQTVPEPTL